MLTRCGPRCREATGTDCYWRCGGGHHGIAHQARPGVGYGLDDEASLVLYDARRTAENEMLEAGHSPRAVGDIFGHSAETMAKHYARSTREQRRRAVESTNKSVYKLTTPEGEMSQMSESGKERKSSTDE